MNKYMFEKQIARIIIEVLENRKGFDWWWDNLDKDIQNEIIEEIAENIAIKIKSAIGGI